MTPFVYVSALVATYIFYVRGVSSCLTPSGGTGNCMSIYDCPQLLAIVSNSKKSQQDINLLRRSQCGFAGDVPKVCCPAVPDKACFTPDKQPGTCVDIHSCPHLATQDTTTFVQNSKCEGPDQHSVCCGPPPNNNPRPSGVCTMTAAPPDPTTRCCGVDNSADDRIITKSKEMKGREAAAVGQYPWTVIIEYEKDNKTKLLCGGALISGRYVLTSAHCVVGEVLNYGIPRNVRLGEYDTSHDGPDCVETAEGGYECTEGMTLIPIEKIVTHPNYQPNLRGHNIALVRLKSIAPYTDFIRPICLPQTDVTANPPTNPLMFIIAGWGAVNHTQGRSDIKNYVDLPYKNQKECQPAYSEKSRKVTLSNDQLCAGGIKGKDACRGDAGGPLMYEHDKIHEVVGIVSFGPSTCGMQDVPGVYTKVYEYNTWIRSNIKP